MNKIIGILLIGIAMLATSCSPQLEPTVTAMSPAAATNLNEEQEIEASVIAVGDIMFHIPQVREAYTENGYDFSLPFEKVRNLISQQDLAIANFETTINERRSLSGYPRFNSPPEVLDAIQKVGFDLLVTANNHCMDTGLEGARNTLDLIKKKQMTPLGTGEENKKAIIDINGIRLGILAYTTSINGLKAPAGFVSMADEEQIKADIQAIKRNCDFILVYMHAGTEYVLDVEAEQIRLFRAIADMGADCIIGSHPHVARQSEVYRTARGKDVFINYSMGNFLSNQNDKYTDIGIITKLILSKKNGETTLKDFEVIPTYRLRFVDKDGRVKRRVILAEDIEGYPQISEADRAYIRKVKHDVTRLLNEEEAEAMKVLE